MVEILVLTLAGVDKDMKVFLTISVLSVTEASSYTASIPVTRASIHVMQLTRRGRYLPVPCLEYR